MLASLALALCAQLSPPPPPPPVPVEGEPCDRIAPTYQYAAAKLAAGDTVEAAALLRKVLEACPDHPYAAELLRIASRDARVQLAAALERPFELAPETPTLAARVELVAFQTAHGLAQGVMLCGFARCPSVPGFGALGAAAGFAGSFALSSHGLLAGQTLAIDAGTFWGSFAALMLSLEQPGQPAFAIVSVGGLVGTGLGTAAALLVVPHAGTVAMMNTGGIFAAWVGFLLGATLIPNLSGTQYWVAGAVPFGLLGGALFGRSHPMTRFRAFVLDIGLVVGTAFGFLTGALAYSAIRSGAYLLMSGGSFGGLAVAWLASRNLDYEVGPEVSLAPLVTARGGYGLAAVARF